MSEESAPVLEFVDLHKEFRLGLRLRRIHAVRGVNLKVEAGEIFGYLGPNGAGKTTTMKMAMGLVSPTRGEVRLFGRPVTDRGVRQRIGYLPEQPHFYDYLTAPEAMDFYGRLFGLAKRERRARTRELLSLVRLEHASDLRLRRFSKGMLQRLGVAQALVGDPDLVVLDEPLSGIDPIGRRELRDVIATLKGAGKTVFFSSHILHDIEMICDRVAIIHQGVLQSVGVLDELLSADAARQQMHLVAHGVPETARGPLEELGGALYDVGQNTIMDVPEVSLDDVLRLLLDAGARVTHVSPQRETLEDLFVREAGRGA